tara:strand:+ start:3744 stop:3980 length:237 start_codon:yes stop_codon:yes gene_type:complete
MINGVQMKKWEIRIKQYEYSLSDGDIQKRSRKNYEVEEILSDFGKDGYELVNVISEKISNNQNNNKYLRTFFLKKERS